MISFVDEKIQAFEYYDIFHCGGIQNVIRDTLLVRIIRESHLVNVIHHNDITSRCMFKQDSRFPLFFVWIGDFFHRMDVLRFVIKEGFDLLRIRSIVFAFIEIRGFVQQVFLCLIGRCGREGDGCEEQGFQVDLETVKIIEYVINRI